MLALEVVMKCSPSVVMVPTTHHPPVLKVHPMDTHRLAAIQLATHRIIQLAIQAMAMAIRVHHHHRHRPMEPMTCMEALIRQMLRAMAAMASSAATSAETRGDEATARAGNRGETSIEASEAEILRGETMVEEIMRKEEEKVLMAMVCSSFFWILKKWA